MVPIVVVPGIVAALILLWVGQLQLRHAETIDSDVFLLNRRRVALGMRRLTGVVYAVALTVAGAPILSYLAAQGAYQRAVTQLTYTIEAQREQLAEADRRLVEARLRLEVVNRQWSSAARIPVATAAVSEAAPAIERPVPEQNAVTAEVHAPDAVSVYLREAPAGRIIGSLKNGEAVTLEAGQAVFSAGHFWTRVRTSTGVRGWVIREAVSASR